MNKKFLIVTVILIFLVAVVIVFRFKKKVSVLSPLGGSVGESKPETKLTTWEDPAGFKFSYPEDLEIDPHEEDTQNYAHLELTSPGHEGKIIIWVKETKYTNIDDWAGEEAGKGQVFDTELGDKPAKKIAYSEPVMLATVTIDVDALVLIEMTPDKQGYWQAVYDQILTSFTFIPIEGEEAAPEGQGKTAPANIIEEPEEVIE